VASARSAAKLLAARAGEADEQHKRTWPELSEYGCFACHKQVTQDLWTTVTSREGKPGSLPWGRWYFGTVDLAAGQPMKDVEELRHLMELTPDRKPVREAALRLADRLDVRLRELKLAAEKESLNHPYPPNYLADRLDATIRHALTPDGKQFRDQDWDGVTQHYLGVAAYYYAAGQVSPPTRDPRLRPTLDRLDRSLIYPKGYSSPADTDPSRLLDLFHRLRPVATTRDLHP
jgi:hypothetical protein